MSHGKHLQTEETVLRVLSHHFQSILICTQSSRQAIQIIHASPTWCMKRNYNYKINVKQTKKNIKVTYTFLFLPSIKLVMQQIHNRWNLVRVRICDLVVGMLYMWLDSIQSNSYTSDQMMRWELYSSNLVDMNWMINKNYESGVRNNMSPIGEKGAYDLNLLLSEVEVWTIMTSDAPSYVTGWVLSHNVRNNTNDRNEWI